MNATAPESTCPVREALALGLLADQSAAPRLGAPELVRCEVAFGSSEYPQVEEVAVVRRADDARFWWVRRSAGQECRVHDSQFTAEFRQWLECNPYPIGRYS